MNQFYYPPLKNSSVKNSINMNTNKILTGPNASGKTTIIKSCLFNILITQQIGIGFYKSCKISPYNHIHCYLNIPDTSGRDSLFQAEARRCRDIIDKVENIKNGTHFCIFDELYSGTNPDEAVASSHVFMKLLNDKDNVSYLLTTHYNDLCVSLKEVDKVSNYCMSATLKDNQLLYNYKLKKGINTIKGGVQVLKQMNFPKHMINETICYLNSNKK
jgi:DNA mismatch repair ATPase MutS